MTRAPSALCPCRLRLGITWRPAECGEGKTHGPARMDCPTRQVNIQRMGRRCGRLSDDEQTFRVNPYAPGQCGFRPLFHERV